MPNRTLKRDKFWGLIISKEPGITLGVYVNTKHINVYIKIHISNKDLEE